MRTRQAQSTATVVERHGRLLVRTRPRAHDARLTVQPIEQPARNRTPESAVRRPIPQSRNPHPVNLSVSPAELRAIGSVPTSTHVVWLPSTMRCSRSQVVNGSRRSASAGASPTSNDDEAEVAGLQHERQRADRLLHRALIHVAAQAGIGARRVRGSRAADRDRCRRPPPIRRRTCRAHRRARPARRARWPPPAAAGAGSSGPTIAGRRAPTAGRAGTRRRAARPAAQCPSARRWRSRRRGSGGGSAVVSVRSSWRARRSDSRSARARMA